MSISKFNFIGSLATFDMLRTLFSEPGYAKLESDIIVELLNVAQPHLLEYICVTIDGVPETECDVRLCRTLFNAQLRVDTDSVDPDWEVWMLKGPHNGGDYPEDECFTEVFLATLSVPDDPPTEVVMAEAALLRSPKKTVFCLLRIPWRLPLLPLLWKPLSKMSCWQPWSSKRTIYLLLLIPELSMQCTIGKNSKEAKCVFLGWGSPCLPCKKLHFPDCEYNLNPIPRGQVHNQLGCCATHLSPNNTQMHQAANAVFDLMVLDGKEGLIGMVFHNAEEHDHYLPYLLSLIGKLLEDDTPLDEEDTLATLATYIGHPCHLHATRFPSSSTMQTSYPDNSDE
ncbi:uncharacterized protein LACBIDRAFT_326614 [Laccaria bicolor S238N-H82]|uniref:Predicted protein n=1 Tax=Laccaria bicolor (strain S238N-H82 / ATCC MYA-4686) TaxID=486041 RepID=B0D981_LACBS|nr:uncharacterized protein LACBIDRAFT_326614 [Laccaria bicolor S238N-H82]EDR09206.1 predicted protein [Laccaria bicolor S238N-H82]|eukprot:XP_001880519.1 predicted protein [Laccaria bicolor S238N-H82]